MEAVIAIILIILMLLFDTNYMEKCIHNTKKNKIIDNLSSKLSIEYMNTSDKLGMVLDKTNALIKPNMWIYNDYEISSREWKAMVTITPPLFKISTALLIEFLFLTRYIILVNIFGPFFMKPKILFWIFFDFFLKQV